MATQTTSAISNGAIVASQYILTQYALGDVRSDDLTTAFRSLYDDEAAADLIGQCKGEILVFY